MAESKKKARKRIYQEDLCFEINLRPNSRDSKPLMVVAFKGASNYTLETHGWIPKLSEVELLTQTLKRISVKYLKNELESLMQCLLH